MPGPGNGRITPIECIAASAIFLIVAIVLYMVFIYRPV